MLFRRHWPMANRAAYLVVRDAGAAEDIAQEAFLSAVRSLDRFDRRRPFGPWLHRIVVNRAIDWSRARRCAARSASIRSGGRQAGCGGRPLTPARPGSSPTTSARRSPPSTRSDERSSCSATCSSSRRARSPKRWGCRGAPSTRACAGPGRARRAARGGAAVNEKRLREELRTNRCPARTRRRSVPGMSSGRRWPSATRLSSGRVAAPGPAWPWAPWRAPARCSRSPSPPPERRCGSGWRTPSTRRRWASRPIGAAYERALGREAPGRIRGGTLGRRRGRGAAPARRLLERRLVAERPVRRGRQGPRPCRGRAGWRRALVERGPGAGRGPGLGPGVLPRRLSQRRGPLRRRRLRRRRAAGGRAGGGDRAGVDAGPLRRCVAERPRLCGSGWLPGRSRRRQRRGSRLAAAQPASAAFPELARPRPHPGGRPRPDRGGPGRRRPPADALPAGAGKDRGGKRRSRELAVLVSSRGGGGRSPRVGCAARCSWWRRHGTAATPVLASSSPGWDALTAPSSPRTASGSSSAFAISTSGSSSPPKRGVDPIAVGDISSQFEPGEAATRRRSRGSRTGAAASGLESKGRIV